MNIQILSGNKWYFLESIHSAYFRTTADVNDALSADYLPLVMLKFPEQTFRSI